MKKLEEIERPVRTGNAVMEWSSDAIAEMLSKLGIEYVTMNPGASYRGFHDSLVNYLGNAKPQMLLCLEEDHVVSIAHGYARATDRPMGCILHSNVGLMHGLMQIFNAYCNRAPMFIMGATGPVDADLRRPWIDWMHTAQDQGSLLRNFTKWDNQPASIPATFEAMLRAYQIARTADPQTLLEILQQVSRSSGTVEKVRSLYMVGQTRIHIDEVRGLGSFLEIEVVLKERQSDAEGLHIAHMLAKEFGIMEDQLVPVAYVDLLRRRSPLP